MVNNESKEELLKEHDNCYVFNSHLENYMDVYELYQKQQGCFWTPQEIDYSRDREVFSRMSDNEKHFFKHILAFFAGADGIVSENISTNFIKDIDIPVIQCTYAWQNAMEFIHNETYSLLLDSIVPDRAEKEELFQSIKTMPIIKKKYDYALKWMTCGCPFRYRIIGYVIFEGIMFSGSFCAIYWNKTKGGKNILEGLCSANEFIARDEGMHTEFGIMLYKKLKHKLSQKEIHNMFRTAYEIEKEFITESIPCNMAGMNSADMVAYIEFLVDFYLKWLGYDIMFGTKNPFSFMEAISLDSKSNFFEHRPSQYQKAKVEHKFTIEEDF